MATSPLHSNMEELQAVSILTQKQPRAPVCPSDFIWKPERRYEDSSPRRSVRFYERYNEVSRLKDAFSLLDYFHSARSSKIDVAWEADDESVNLKEGEGSNKKRSNKTSTKLWLRWERHLKNPLKYRKERLAMKAYSFCSRR